MPRVEKQRTGILVVCAVALLVLPACRDTLGARDRDHAQAQITHFQQPEPLLHYMFELLQRADRAGLQSLMVTEEEYRNIILAGSDSEERCAMPEEKAQWFTRLHRTKSAYALEDLIRTTQAQAARLSAVELVGGSRPYRHYRLLPTPLLRLQKADGTEVELRPGLLVDLGGQVKVLSYFSDD